MENNKHPNFYPLPYDKLINKSYLEEKYRALLKFLYDELDDQFEIVTHEEVFTEKLSILVLRKKLGAFLIDVCSFDSLNLYVKSADFRNLKPQKIKWFYKGDSIDSPFSNAKQNADDFINTLSPESFKKIVTVCTQNNKIIRFIPFFYNISRKDLSAWFAKFKLNDHISINKDYYKCICNDELISGFKSQPPDVSLFFNKNRNVTNANFDDDLYNNIKDPFFQI